MDAAADDGAALLMQLPTKHTSERPEEPIVLCSLRVHRGLQEGRPTGPWIVSSSTRPRFHQLVRSRHTEEELEQLSVDVGALSNNHRPKERHGHMEGKQKRTVSREINVNKEQRTPRKHPTFVSIHVLTNMAAHPRHGAARGYWHSNLRQMPMPPIRAARFSLILLFTHTILPRFLSSPAVITISAPSPPSA